MDRLAKAISPIAIPNITTYLVAFQAIGLMMIWLQPAGAHNLLFDPVKVAEGEWWRAVTFLFMPPDISPIWSAFALYFFWLMGTALESNWGTARFNLYLLIAAVMSIGGAFLPMAFGFPAGVATNAFIGTSVFLAFAVLYPDFVIYLFFILPVRIKWLALIAWIGMALSFVIGDWMTRVLVVVSVANFLFFFWREIIERIRFGRKQMSRQVKRITKTSPMEMAAVFHRCVVCGATEKTHPQLEFRYCTDCGSKCYCMEHLRTHRHEVGVG